MIGLLLAANLLTGASAHAADGPDWEAVDRRSRNTYVAGWAVVGTSAAVTAAHRIRPEALVFGPLGLLIAAPVPAGAALRQRRAQVKQGREVSSRWGTVAWATMGTGAVLLPLGGYLAWAEYWENSTKHGESEPAQMAAWTGMAALGGLCALSSPVFAELQVAENRRARGGSVRDVQSESSIQVTLGPMLGPASGVALNVHSW